MVDVQMSSIELAKTKMQTNSLNRMIGVNDPGTKNSLGKDSFLKLLVTQLQHQDPTRPMEDREFISQMAQFSSLEQMTNLNKEVRALIKSSKSSEAYGMLGKMIDAFNPVTKKTISGIVSSIRFSDNEPSLIVGKEEVAIKNIHAVHNFDDKSKRE